MTAGAREKKEILFYWYVLMRKATWREVKIVCGDKFLNFSEDFRVKIFYFCFFKYQTEEIL